LERLQNIPSSVYRLQIGAHFPIQKVIDLLEYLDQLGVEGIQCSPIFDSFETGYDVTDPHHLNPKLGTLDEFESLCSALSQRKMKHILDVIPHHMGIRGNNVWFMDVLQKGAKSPYADYFDINWLPEKEELKGKILLPILNQNYGQALERGDIQLVCKKDPSGKDQFLIQYFDFLLPIAVAEGTLLSGHTADQMHRLLEQQYYRLALWAIAGQEINYRRFFNINNLIAIHIEKEKVLDDHHKWIFELVRSGKVQGLRIDHPDGLYDPSCYFERIAQKAPCLIWIEKILNPQETLPEKWQVDGTVGYEFLNIVGGLFVQKKSQQFLTESYSWFTQEKINFNQLCYEKRKNYMAFHMSSEVNFLGLLVSRISEKNRATRDFTRADLTRACLEIMACFPV